MKKNVEHNMPGLREAFLEAFLSDLGSRSTGCSCCVPVKNHSPDGIDLCVLFHLHVKLRKVANKWAAIHFINIGVYLSKVRRTSSITFCSAFTHEPRLPPTFFLNTPSK